MNVFQKLRFLLKRESPAPINSEENTSSDSLKIPLHLAVIMDGNGRWAKQRGLPRSAGHRSGGENLKNLCRNCGNYGVRYLTVYAFSTENWSRPDSEISALMELFVEFFERYDAELEKEGIRVRFSGDIQGMPERVRRVCEKAEQNSLHRQKMDLIIALNYGGRREIVQACQKIAERVQSGTLDIGDIDEAVLSRNMYLPDIPDPDLIIRPSGEMRLSNFLTWESAYSELWVSDRLWPDFDHSDLTEAFTAFTKRDRRFGGLSKMGEKKESEAT